MWDFLQRDRTVGFSLKLRGFAPSRELNPSIPLVFYLSHTDFMVASEMENL